MEVEIIMGGRSSKFSERQSRGTSRKNSGKSGTRMVGKGYNFVVDHQDDYGGIF